MTTYRLADAYGSAGEFDAADATAARAIATGILTAWWVGELDRSETHVLRANLTVLEVVGGEEGDWEWDWIHLTDVEVTVAPVEPPCIDADGHDWEAGKPRGSDGRWGITWTDVCPRCGLRHTVDTWHEDHVTGRGFRWERYEPAEAHEEEVAP